jgi:ribosomal-protein-serine acetyltransferase
LFKTILSAGPSIGPLTLDHAPDLFALVERNRSYFVEWIPFVGKTKAVADCESYIGGYVEKASSGEGFLCGIWEKRLLIGIILVREIDREARWAEIGYMIAEDHSGKGIITEACRKLIDFIFGDMDLGKAVLCCDDQNAGSIAIARKLGFTFEGNVRNHYVVNGKVRNMNYWGLLRQERMTEEA